ncbi:MAG: PASTA domain-containing protein [Melioribacter sp.]|nr:PASTA domain-containing protein [Melioribacter sp.]
MKKPSKISWKKLLYILGGIFVFLFVIDYILLPLYVSGSEHKVPNVVGKQKDEAIKILEDAGLNPVVQTSRYDQKYQKDHVIFQNPAPNLIVKSNRRIYLTISGGEPQIPMPSLIGKTIRDATVTLERLGLSIGKIDSIESEFPAGIIVEQQYFQGKEISKGSAVNFKLSIGPQVGMVRVPSLFGQTLSEAEKILKNNSLRVGNKVYIFSQNYLPNTVVDQYPSINTLAKIGDSVTVTLTRTK